MNNYKNAVSGKEWFVVFLLLCFGCASNNTGEVIRVRIEGDGTVVRPGNYVLSAGSSLGDLLDMAGIDYSYGEFLGPMMQRILVSRSVDGERITRAYNCSNNANNNGRKFLLHNGDEVVVPRIWF